MNLKTFLTLIIVCASSFCYGDGAKKELKFAKGASSTMVEGSVIRGDSDAYQIAAKAGQTMKVSVSAQENNAAFIIYLPNSQETVKKAGESDEAQKWTGKLPKSGTYRIVVSGTRGNASYKLSVAIK